MAPLHCWLELSRLSCWNAESLEGRLDLGVSEGTGRTGSAARERFVIDSLVRRKLECAMHTSLCRVRIAYLGLEAGSEK